MLFTAKFADNTFLEQDSGDVSKLNNSKSQFFDVLEKEKESFLEMFCLTNGNFYYLLDLRSGRFEINEQSIFINKIDYPNPLRLIYYITRGATFSQNGVGMLPSIYNIGFQTNDNDDKNIKQILQIHEDSGLTNFIT